MGRGGRLPAGRAAGGPVVATLFHTATSSAVDVHGILVGTSTIESDDITATTTGCSMPIRTVTELAAALKAGIIYANVHSVQFPNGVARGQLTLTSSSTSHTSTTTPPTGTSTPPTGTTTPTTTPPVIRGLGSSISAFVHTLLQNDDHKGIGEQVAEFIRGLRMLR